MDFAPKKLGRGGIFLIFIYVNLLSLDSEVNKLGRDFFQFPHYRPLGCILYNKFH